MTNHPSTASFEELQTFEARLELTNRINMRGRLNQLLLNPHADLKDILTLAKILAEMVDQSLQKQKQDHADEKALSRDRELALAESKVENQRESLAIARLKLETKKTPSVHEEEFTPKPDHVNPSNIIVPAHLAGKVGTNDANRQARSGS